MRLALSILLLLSACLSTGTAPLGAQSASEPADIIHAALLHLRGTIPEGPAALEPHTLCAKEERRWVCPEWLERRAAALDLLIRPLEEVYSCPGDPSTCRLEGVNATIRFVALEIKRDMATAQVRVSWSAASTRQPVPFRVNVLTLRRDASGWRVSQDELRLIT